MPQEKSRVILKVHFSIKPEQLQDGIKARAPGVRLIRFVSALVQHQPGHPGHQVKRLQLVIIDRKRAVVAPQQQGSRTATFAERHNQIRSRDKCPAGLGDRLLIYDKRLLPIQSIDQGRFDSSPKDPLTVRCHRRSGGCH